MREKALSESGLNIVSLLTYRDVGSPAVFDTICDHPEARRVEADEAVYEEEVKRRIAQACEETAMHWRRECEEQVNPDRGACSGLVAGGRRSFEPESRRY